MPMFQPDLFVLPKQPSRRLTKLEKKAAYHAIRFYLFSEKEDHLSGKMLTAVYSAMEKLKVHKKSRKKEKE